MQLDVNDVRNGMKLEIDNQPYLVVGIEFIKPGKGQAFTRVRIKHLLLGKVLERTFKSGEKVDIADVSELAMRYLYKEPEAFVFMDDNSYEQLSVTENAIGDKSIWLVEDLVYTLTLYKGEVVDITPPTFLELKVVETAPGVRGDTVSGRVLKPAITQTGAKIQIPIFINEGEVIKVDTRTGEYVSRVS